MSFKKSVVISLVVLCVFALFMVMSLRSSVNAASETVVEAKVVKEAKPLTFDGVAYIAGHGGHLAILDLRTMKSPSDVENDRIVLTEAGSEMEGKVAGISFAEVKKSGGSHGQTLLMEKGKKVLIASTLAGNVYKIELDANGRTAKKEGPFKVGEKFCGTITGPDGNIYLEDMTDGNVYVWNPESLKLVEKMPAGMAVCGIQWTKNNQKAYISDMPAGKVYVYDWKTKKKVKEITSPGMTFIHQVRMTLDGKQLWVSAPNEFEPNPGGTGANVLKGGTQPSQVIIIDTNTDSIVKRILLPKNLSPHDFAFTKNGYVLLSSRSYGSDDSLLAVMNMKNDTIVEEVSLCASCHNPAGVKVAIDSGSPLLCGITVDWKK
jgi:hypothetical protein